MALRAVIFDVDGTLIDSNDAHAEAWLRAFHEALVPVTREAVRHAIGMGGDKLLPSVSGIDAESEAGRRLSARRAEIFEAHYLSGLTPFPGAADLIATLGAKGFLLGIASSSKRTDLEKLLTVAGLTDLIEKKTAGDEVEESKPEPDIVVAALQHLGVSAGEAVMIGDTPYDVKAARGAGVACIAFRCGGWRDSDLAGALAIYHGPLHLLARLDSSPLANHYVR